VTIQSGYEVPYLSQLKFIDAQGQEQQISVPELAAPVLVHPGDRFSFAAEAVDYNGLPLTYQWSLVPGDATAPAACSGTTGTYAVVSGVDSARVTFDAPEHFCNAQLSLSISNGKSTWQAPVATLKVAAVAPQVQSIHPPSNLSPGANITLSADVAHDSATSVSYAWSLSGPNINTQRSSDVASIFTLLNRAQSYYACLEITDGYGQTGSSCIDLVVPTDWQLMTSLSPANYINVASPTTIDSIAFGTAVVIERFDLATKQARVVNAVPNDYGTTWGNIYSVAGDYFGLAASSSAVVHRLDVPLMSSLSVPDQSPVFSAAGRLWALIRGESAGSWSWQYLEGDSWQAGEQTDQMLSPTTQHFRTVVGRDDGQFLVLFYGDSSSAVFECNVNADCQLLGTIDVQINANTAPIGLGWTSDGRAVVMQGLTAWRHDATGWAGFSTRSDYANAAILAMGNGATCYALPSASSLENWSVWCLDEQGWR